MAALCVAGAAVASAQQGESGPLWFVHQEVARPGMLAEYDSTTKELFTMAVKNKAPLLSQAVVLEGEDLMYTIAVPVKDGNASQAINAEFGLLAAKEGAKFADVMKRGMAPVESMREFLLQEHPELSYRPAKPAPGPGEAHFITTISTTRPGPRRGAGHAKDFLAAHGQSIANGLCIFTSWRP